LQGSFPIAAGRVNHVDSGNFRVTAKSFFIVKPGPPANISAFYFNTLDTSGAIIRVRIVPVTFPAIAKA
jgi:hypothetical protein